MSDNQAPTRHVAIIGGGISGLAAAFRLGELDPTCRITLLEAGPRLGGVLSTVHEDGYQVEQSADNFITTVPWALNLCHRAGIPDEQLVRTNPAFRHTFVVRRGKLRKLPDGFLMMAPTRMWPMAVTPILSPMGKLRAALEYFLPPRREPGDESMAAFVRRRLGREVFDRLVEPLVSAVYAADMEKLSLEATLSQFREMEQKHGSLIRAMRSRMHAAKGKGPRGESGDTGARYSMFVTPRNGLTSLVDAIAARLPPGSCHLNTRIASLVRADAGRWAIGMPDGSTRMADAVILAAPAPVSAKLLAPIDAELSTALGSIEHSGTAILSTGYDRAQIKHPLDGMGVVVPAVERSPLLACSLSSQKYPHRAPEGKILLRAFVGGAQHPEMATMEDDRLVPLVEEALEKLLGIRGKPAYRNIARWPGTMPQYHVGHKQLVARIEARAAKLVTLQLAGNAFHGVGIPHCIHSGEQAAESVMSAISRVWAIARA